jgi:hypothetical protein
MILDPITSSAPDANLSRRNFLAASAAVGGGLVLSLSVPLGRSEAATSEVFAGGDGQVVLTMSYVEMGQGTYTSYAERLGSGCRFSGDGGQCSFFDEGCGSPGGIVLFAQAGRDESGAFRRPRR